MLIEPYNLNTTSKAVQNYNNINGAQSTLNESRSGGLEIENQSLKKDTVTINSNQTQFNTNFQNNNNLEEPLYSNTNFQQRGNLQTLETRLNNIEPQTNVPLRAEATETTAPPEIEAPPIETSGSTENLETKSNIKTVIPVATNTNGTNGPQVQVTTTGVYTNNPGVALQASLSIPFTVDQTV